MALRIVAQNAMRRPGIGLHQCALLPRITKRSHAGHKHHHDTSFLTSTDRMDAGVRITRIGLYANLAMAAAKGVGGYMFHSHALVADAWHSITDLASDVLTLGTVSWSLKKPTAEFPTGFGKIEALGALGVSGMLFMGGLAMGWGSLAALMNEVGVHIDIAFLHVHHHGHSHGTPSIHAAWLAAGTVVVKEWLYHKTMAVARARKSSVLASNALHHRVDSLTGVVALSVVLASNFFQNAAWLDPVGGLLISAMVIRGGAVNTWSALKELADRAIDHDVVGSVKTRVADVLDSPDVQLIDVGGVKSGQNLLIDVTLKVPATLAVAETEGLEQRVREAVGKIRGAKRVRVRFTTGDVLNEFVH